MLTDNPVVPFVNFGSGGVTLRKFHDYLVAVDLPSPPLPFGSNNFTTAVVSMTIVSL